jgi:hypothetical protein
MENASESSGWPESASIEVAEQYLGLVYNDARDVAEGIDQYRRHPGYRDVVGMSALRGTVRLNIACREASAARELLTRSVSTGTERPMECIYEVNAAMSLIPVVVPQDYVVRLEKYERPARSSEEWADAVTTGDAATLRQWRRWLDMLNGDLSPVLLGISAERLTNSIPKLFGG